MSKKTYTAADLILRIRNRYSDGRRYVVMEEVADGTGAAFGRRIDAMVVSMWPSDGLTRRALEIKVSRSDFLRELAEPAKSLWVREQCHEFWYVAPYDVIKEPELPEGAGWLRPHGDTLAIVRAAAHHTPPPLDDALFASMCRSLRDEHDRALREMRRTAVEADPAFTRAKAWERAGKAVLSERHIFPPDNNTPAAIVDALRKATQNKQGEEEREHVTAALAQFQMGIVELFDVFCVIAHVGLLERDEVGELVARAYGLTDKGALAAQRAEAKAKAKRPGWAHHAPARIVRCRDYLNRLLGEGGK